MLKFGNHKIGDDTAIFNMGTARGCPAKALGLCETHNNGIKCYALKAEQQYPMTVPSAREKQHEEWISSTREQLLVSFSRKIGGRRKGTSYLRFNESGDFYSQEDISKLSYIAEGLKEANGITTYGYSARSDLDFSNARFLVKGSGHDKGTNGRTTVIRATDPVPNGYIECPGSCKRCNLCKISVAHNIAFRAH